MRNQGGLILKLSARILITRSAQRKNARTTCGFVLLRMALKYQLLKSDIQKYSIIKAIREHMQGNQLTGLEREMAEEAKREMHNISSITGLGISSKILMNKVIMNRTVLGAASSPVVPQIGNLLIVWAGQVLVPLGTEAGLRS